MISYTSRIALQQLISKLDMHESQRRRVYAAVRDWSGKQGPSRDDIARVTGMPINSVCGRVHQLLQEGILIRGPLKIQENIPGKKIPVETLEAVVYSPAEPILNPTPQLQLL